MSKKETEGKEARETIELEAKAQGTVVEEPPVEEQAAKETAEVSKAPEPTATGNEKIEILKHDIYRKDGGDAAEAASIELTVKNISDTTIGSALFEAELYDIDGNVLDKAETKTNAHLYLPILAGLRMPISALRDLETVTLFPESGVRR